MNKTRLGVIGGLMVAALAAGALLLASPDSTEATETDGAFLVGMVPHHEGAIEMAEMAQERAEHPQISELAGEITEAQEGEIAQIEGIHERLFDEPIGDASHGTLGLDAETMGMDGSAKALVDARPFDRFFIDMMIPHHQGAIAMARVELASGQDPETIELAEGIIEAQSAEIEAMNQWRERWYGSPSPAGGVPSESETVMPSHEQMGH